MSISLCRLLCSDRQFLVIILLILIIGLLGYAYRISHINLIAVSRRKMEQNIDDFLSFNKVCKHIIEYDNKVFSQKKCDRIGLCPQVKISQEILENLVTSELKEKYAEFVKYYENHSNECTLKALKNIQKSIEARIKGNTLFAKKDHNVDIHEEIWKLYSKSIAWAPAGSKELVLAYECRSNLLLHFKKYEDCIKDINRALAMTEFDLLKVKLLCRKMTCFVAINKDVAEKEELWKILNFHFEQINGAFKDEKFLNIIEQAKNNVDIQHAGGIKDDKNCFASVTTFTNIGLRHNNKGKHIIANRDFVPGEPIIVTKPTIASVNSDKFYAYCSHCLSFMWAGIPCDECCLCMYCSVECKTEAWEKYHILECKFKPHIDFSHPIYFKFISSMKIFFMGVTEFGSIPKLIKKVKEVEQSQDDLKLVRCDEFLENKFFNFYTLRNKPYTDTCSLASTAKYSCFLMAYLTQISDDIFEKEVGSMKGKQLAKDEDFVSIAVVLLKIMMLCERYNIYSVQNKFPKCPKYESTKECKLKRCCLVGKVFYFFHGLVEKSCNPNADICQSEDGKIVYFCTQPIKKMEVITVAETVPFYVEDMIKRHGLKACVPSVHEFCTCIACEREWPPFLLQIRKFGAKSMRRSSKVQTRGTELLGKYVDRLRDCPPEYFAFDLDGFQELARDTKEVVSLCGQPSHISSWMIWTLCQTFQNLYGDCSVQSRMPKDC